MAPKLTREEVKKHTAEDDLWFIVDHKVYDVSDFIDAHPGGSVVLQQVAGTDATEAFYNLHRHEVLHQYKSLCLGNVEGEEPEVIEQLPGDLSQVPYAEPLWLTPQFRSPFYSEKHKKLQKAMRKFVDEHITPEAREKELSGEYISQELIDKMAEANILAMRAGPGKHMHGRSLLGGAMDGKDYDAFSDLIISQELTRHTSRGFQDGNMAGMTISLSAVIAWANDEELKNRVVDEVLSGKKKMCLAITEAFAGSDVAGLRTTAELSEDGSHYIVNGTKKWITNGMWSDYFVTGCKTKKGFSVLLIERSEGVETKKIKTAYSAAAATTFVEFDNVKVPAKNLLGEEHKGFVVIMSNFNHERWMMAAMVMRWSRTVLEECLKWAHQRLVFGKPLIAQPVVRQKLGRMIALVEANQAWIEQITFQMNGMSYKEQAKHLSGPIGLLKTFSTRSAHEIADNAVNIFGGRGVTQTGMGRVVEAFHRTYKFDSILGGAEEVMADLGVRQAMRFMPNAKL
ncbi:acyl-CoA dehydrogenase/oxidase [Neohortaea acidophila]|uniref:Acyl-CoA dehydrogenase/oxidase n=1 Tax=Neohortaea acidophila TaxID=245834 RepID=A0A6A6PKG3_9PEZI|nr:acyl-CoA dehydrogenase/oxidase [Neohortaea acidophila]KAF2480415.1 acyl-CoA dehydrogenase/oxidase [Neohortaea acidophila]